jgi:hypothetical protein
MILAAVSPEEPKSRSPEVMRGFHINQKKSSRDFHPNILKSQSKSEPLRAEDIIR